MRIDQSTWSSFAILTLFLLMPGSEVLPGLGQSPRDPLAPTAPQRLAPTASPREPGCFEVERYTEDFETGWASNWYLGPGFQIVTDGGTKRLSGAGASDGLATYLAGDYWTEFSFSFKICLARISMSVACPSAPPRG